jgi:hypothetical protein
MNSQQDIICRNPNILVPQFSEKYKRLSLVLKEIMYNGYISYKRTYIFLFISVTAHVMFNLLHFLAV